MGRLAFPLAGLALLAAVAGIAGTAHLSRRAEVRAERPERVRLELPDAPPRHTSPHSPEVRLLLYHLRYGSNLKRAHVTRGLANLGPFARSAIPELVEFLTHEDDWWGRVRGEIEDVLIAIGPDAIPAARALVTHADPRAQASGMRVLARLQRHAAIPALAALLKQNRDVAAYLLADLGDQGLDALIAAVADPEVKLGTVRAALKRRGKAAAPGLAALLAAEDQATRERAAVLLAMLGKNARGVAAAVVGAIANPGFGNRAPLVKLLPLLDTVPPDSIHAAARMVADLPFAENGRRIREVWATGRETYQLKQPERRLVSTGRADLAPLRVLAELGPRARAVLPVLLEIMRSEDPVAAALAANAHWRISGDPEVARDALVAMLAEDTGNVWPPALGVLGAMGADARPAAPALERYAESANFHQRHYARRILASFEPAESEDEVEEAAPAAPPNVWPLRLRLRDPKRRDRRAILRKLARLGEDAAPAVPELIELLAHEDLRPDAANTLGAIGPAAYDAVPALEPYVEDPWWRARRAVIEALWKITGEANYREMAFDPDRVKAGDLWALPLLIDRLPRKDAIRALGRLGADARPAITDLTRIVADEGADEYARDAARAALAKIEKR